MSLMEFATLSLILIGVVAAVGVLYVIFVNR
jgi:hypothetical protein